MKEEFKLFVRKKPELIKYVNSGKMTWQKFYEQWNLYGEESSVWDSYKDFKEEKEETFNFNNLINSIKNVDMASVQKGVNSMQKAIELFQGLVTKKTTNLPSYEPRQLFKKFED